jgi:hypothetical protein
MALDLSEGPRVLHNQGVATARPFLEGPLHFFKKFLQNDSMLDTASVCEPCFFSSVFVHGFQGHRFPCSVARAYAKERLRTIEKPPHFGSTNVTTIIILMLF